MRDNWAAEQISTKRVQEDRGIRVLVEAARPLSKSIGDKTVVGTSQSAPFTLGGMQRRSRFWVACAWSCCLVRAWSRPCLRELA